jgi:hypothetical protein
MREKLIRNLRPGDEIQVTIDLTPRPKMVERVKVTRVEEVERGGITHQRRWRAHFEPKLLFNSWHSVTGYSDTKIPVYPK